MERWFEKSCRCFFAYLFAGINVYPYIVLVKLKISWRMIIKTESYGYNKRHLV